MVADKKAIQQSCGGYNNLISEREDAEADGDHERLEEFQFEMAQRVAAVTEDQGKGCKLRKVTDRRNNVRDASVDRAIKQIDNYDKPLAEYLKACIKHGNEVVCQPERSITWDVRPIVNA